MDRSGKVSRRTVVAVVTETNRPKVRRSSQIWYFCHTSKKDDQNTKAMFKLSRCFAMVDMSQDAHVAHARGILLESAEL